MTASQRTAVFRVDASVEIGGGHVIRALALAEALTERGWRCLFAVNPEASTTVKALPLSPHDIATLSTDSPDTFTAVAPSCDVAIIDHYQLGTAYEASLRGWAHRIVVFDDRATHPHDCDLLIDPTLGRNAHEYAVLTPADCDVRVGPCYAPLRPQFSAAMKPAPLTTPVAIMVALGLTDPTGATRAVIEALAPMAATVRVTVVCGTRTPTLPAVRTACERAGFTLLCDVDDMARLMRNQHLVIGAAGSSSWERCALGLPTALVVVADNQRLITDRLAAAGAAVIVGDARRLSPSALYEAIGGLVNNLPSLRRMGAAARNLCDGYGAGRIADVISSATARP